ncbi:MAG: homocysteine S-methyltransferase family protein [Candidatus Omnitrophota bacterium]
MSFEEFLKQKGVILADGAMGTLLAERGLLASGQAPETLNLFQPEAIAEIHRDYLDAGSEIILTNTFGANLFKLRRSGLEGKFEEINRKAVLIARELRKEQTFFIAGDLGPSGEILEPIGSLSPKKLAAAYQKQAAILVEGGVDFVLLETMSSAAEVKVIVAAIREKQDIPLVVSFTFFPGRKGPRTLMGESPKDVAESFGAHVLAIGSNCGEGVPEVIAVISQMREHTDSPLWAKPNAGKPYLSNGKTFFPLGPSDMAEQIQGLVEAGAGIIGGCCGTTPQHIALMKRKLLLFNNPMDLQL